MEPAETVYVEDATVGCDGGGGGLGHPKVFLNLAEKGQVDCPYCGRRFISRAAGNGDSGDGGGNGNGNGG